MQNTSEGAENRVYVHRYSPLQETLGEGFSGYCGVLVVLTRGMLCYDLLVRFHCMFFIRFDPVRNNFHIHVEEEEEESVFVFCL